MSRKKRDRVVIFDTTLRDGEQSPGASLNHREKLEVAHQLAQLNVDVIEAGFPIASQGDFESVKAVAETVKDSTICGLARALEKDIDRAGEALKNANSGRIHTFIATSPIHMQHKLRMSPDQVVEQAVFFGNSIRHVGRCDVQPSCRFRWPVSSRPMSMPSSTARRRANGVTRSRCSAGGKSNTYDAISRSRFAQKRKPKEP